MFPSASVDQGAKARNLHLITLPRHHRAGEQGERINILVDKRVSYFEDCVDTSLSSHYSQLFYPSTKIVGPSF